MNRILVWDLPIRVLHWGFAGSLTAALALGFGVDDEHPLFVYHMLFGLIAGFVLVARIVLGIIGSRYARFASWAWSPRALGCYLRGVFKRDAARFVSHNPASSWVSAAMFVIVAGLVATGIAARKQFEDTHEVLAVLLAGAIALHLLGLVWHTARHRENIARSMLDGRKRGAPELALRSHHAAAGILVATAVIAWAVALFDNYDARGTRVRLPWLGREIELGESHDSDKPSARRELHQS